MAALNKIAATSSSRSSPSELETSIANALYELETNIPDLKSALRPLQFVSAREVSFRIPSICNPACLENESAIRASLQLHLPQYHPLPT
jgi:Ribosomal protein S7e